MEARNLHFQNPLEVASIERGPLFLKSKFSEMLRKLGIFYHIFSKIYSFYAISRSFSVNFSNFLNLCDEKMLFLRILG